METKKDLRGMLKSGRIIELRNGSVGIIIQTHLGLLVQFDQAWTDVERYDENLSIGTSKLNDIMSIRQISHNYQVIRGDLKFAPIIWERNDMVKEYTLDQVLKMAGLEKASVKIVG